MNIANYIWTAKVQGKNISPWEGKADLFLSPSRYFFGGRVVDLIERNDQFAIQLGEPSKAPWYVVALKVVAIIPGLIIGGLIKLSVIWSKRKTQEVKFICQHLKDPIGQVHGPDRAFVEQVQRVINALNKLPQAIKYLKTKHNNFLSERYHLEIDPIQEMSRLILDRYEEPMPTTTDFTWHDRRPKKKQPLTLAEVVMENIDLFWNLRLLFMDRTRNVSLSQKESIRAINPRIVYDHVISHPEKPLYGAIYEFASKIPAFQTQGHRLGSRNDAADH